VPSLFSEVKQPVRKNDDKKKIAQNKKNVNIILLLLLIMILILLQTLNYLKIAKNIIF